MQVGDYQRNDWVLGVRVLREIREVALPVAPADVVGVAAYVVADVAADVAADVVADVAADVVADIVADVVVDVVAEVVAEVAHYDAPAVLCDVPPVGFQEVRFPGEVLPINGKCPRSLHVQSGIEWER